MRIKELYIENFGKLSEYRQVFGDGLNSFCNDNGYGKTTLTFFIKSMLYGLEDTRRQALSENDRKKYFPWQGGAFGGWLIFESRGKQYRVERSFGQKASDDTFSLYEVDTGMPSDDFSENLGEKLFGIDADGFERTVFLSEKNISGKNDNPTISAKLSNLVGVEGDIGGFDEAIDLLDKRRKFYQKKGGSGEIQEIRRSITEAEDELISLDTKQERCRKNEELISEISEKISEAKFKKSALLEKQRTYMLEKEKESYNAHYKEMLDGLRAEELRRDELAEFFARKLPTNAEIGEVSSYFSEALRLESAAASQGEDTEYSSLARFFSLGTSYEECDRMARLAEALDEKEKTSDRSESEKEYSPFVRIPSEREIENASAKLSGKGKKTSSVASFILLTLIGAIILSVGSILGQAVNGALYALAAVGAIITVIGIAGAVASHGKRESTEVGDFIKEIYGDGYTFDSELSALIGMRADLERYKSELAFKESEERARRANAENVLRMQRELDGFFSRFPIDASTLTEKVRLIQTKYRRYRFLEETEGRNEGQRIAYLERSARLRRMAEEFVSLFPTVTDDPMNEIRNRLAELEVLRSAVERRRDETQRFAAAHGITSEGELIAPSSDSSAELAGSISGTEEELIELERQKSIAESEYASLSRELEGRPVLEEKLLELKERAELYEENLSVIQKAKELLAKAKTNMTAKYLDGTRRGFDKYMSLIESADGEFSMDTSFTVMKRDLGASRQAEAYSRGTRDLHALAVRLALVDALYENDLPPIILDDPFTAFDDTHIERAFSVLKKLSHNRQIIYFTCSKSRKAK